MAFVLEEKKKWLQDFYIGRQTNEGKDCDKAPKNHEQY